MDQYSSFHVVILAAGESRRFGSPKQLANWQGETLLLSIIKKVLACGIEPYVAIGANSETILKDESLERCRNKVILIKEWSLGLSSSIKESVEFLEEKSTKGIVFLLADQPLIELSFYKYFFSQAQLLPNELLSTSYRKLGGKIGVPAYFPVSFFNALKQQYGDHGAKNILILNDAKAVNYQGELIDIDEPEDLAHAKKMLRNN